MWDRDGVFGLYRLRFPHFFIRGGFEYVAILIRSMKDLLINIQIIPTLLGAIVINFYIF